MAEEIVPPTFSEYLNFIDGDASEYSPEEQERIQSVLTMASDAFWVFTGLSTYPDSSERVRRLIRYAILDLTAWLLAQSESRDAINSPFSSERIGSYSYSKMQASARGENSGIYWLDMFFRWLGGLADDGPFATPWVTSENVMNPGWKTYAELEQEDSDNWVYKG